MRRLVAIVAAMYCVVGVSTAQNRDELDRTRALRDSLVDALTECRAEYLRNEARREVLTPSIVKLERELATAQQAYESCVEGFTKRDVRAALEGYERVKSAPMAAMGEEESSSKGDESSLYTPDQSRMRRDLVANDYFVARLSEADYHTLREAQYRESEVKRKVEVFMSQYAELVALHRKYMEVNSSSEADSIKVLFDSKRGQMLQTGVEVESIWNNLYYNKMYAYDLLMERDANSAMLDLSASVAASAEREINGASDLYESNMLVGYYARKKALVEYELGIASALSLTTSRDSLRVVAAELKNRDYRLSRLSLPRRSFIPYESITIKGANFYNAKNPIPRTEIYDYGTVYRIRIGLFRNRPNISAFRGVTPISCTNGYNGGLYAYFVGAFATEQEAREGVAKLKKLGFREPIIAVWIDGEYYPTLDDVRIMQSRYNIELSGIATLTEEIKSKIVSHNSDCTISRVGSSFVIGSFESKSVAEAIASELRKVDGEIEVTIVKQP